MSCSCRAGWSIGIFKAVKLYQSSSMLGPSATTKPISPKIEINSSVVWLIGCIVPISSWRIGNVTSMFSRNKRELRSEFSKSFFLVSRSEMISFLRRLSSWPTVLRCSGSKLPRPFINAVISPFLPSADIRICSKVSLSVASEISFFKSVLRSFTSAIFCAT